MAFLRASRCIARRIDPEKYTRSLRATCPPYRADQTGQSIKIGDLGGWRASQPIAGARLGEREGIGMHSSGHPGLCSYRPGGPVVLLRYAEAVPSIRTARAACPLPPTRNFTAWRYRCCWTLRLPLPQITCQEGFFAAKQSCPPLFGYNQRRPFVPRASGGC
jgi:hypothetical protein